jgi:hypothetical protein
MHSNINAFCHLYQLKPNMSVTVMNHKACNIKAVTLATKEEKYKVASSAVLPP